MGVRPTCNNEQCVNHTKQFVSSGRYAKYCSPYCKGVVRRANRLARDPDYADHLRTLNRERNRQNYRDSVSWRNGPGNLHIVYCWYRAGIPVYIGMSSTGEKRAYDHVRDSWFTSDLEVIITPMSSRDVALETELRLIKQFRPDHNKQGVINGRFK